MMNVIDVRNPIKTVCAIEGYPNSNKRHNKYKIILANPVRSLDDLYPSYFVLVHKVKVQYLTSIFSLKACWAYAHFAKYLDKKIVFVKGAEDPNAVSQKSAFVEDKVRRLLYFRYLVHAAVFITRAYVAKRKELPQSRPEAAKAASIAQKQNSQLPIQKVVEEVVKGCDLSVPPLAPKVPTQLHADPTPSLKGNVSKKESGIKQKVEKDMNVNVGKNAPKISWKAYLFNIVTGKLKKVVPETNEALFKPVEMVVMGKRQKTPLTSSKSTDMEPNLKPTIKEIVSRKLQDAEERVLKYQNLLEKIHMFIADKPELQQLCADYMVIDQENIVLPSANVPEYLNTHNEIDIMTRTTIKANNLQHAFDEYIEFIKRNDEVAAAFEKYIAADLPAFKAFQKLLQSPKACDVVHGYCKIEEIIK